MSRARNGMLALLLAGGCGGGTSGSADGDGAGAPSESGPPAADSSTTDDRSGGPPDDAARADGADAPVTSGDSDGDGISDADEAAYADLYMPFVSIHPSDSCPTHGLLLRISPHPKEPKRVMMWVDVLYNEDCGALGHAGDDEVFGVVIDPARQGADGILAVRGISHQGTACEHSTTCGTCKGMTACSTGTRNGKPYPALYPSKDKHGNYADLGTCTGSFLCDSGGCALAPASADEPKVNAGEPGHPLVHDLTTQGFVTAQNGWTKSELLDFDPWKAGTFGGAGDVSKDLVDTSFVVDTTACP